MFRGPTRSATMALVLSGIVGVAAAGATHNEAETAPAMPVAGGDAVSDWLLPAGKAGFIALTVSYASEEPVTIVTREGELASYKSFSQEESFGLVPRIDEQTGEVIVQMVSIAGERPTYRVLGVKETLRAPESFPMVTSTTDRRLPVSITATIISQCERLALSSEAKCEVAEDHQRGSLFISDALRPAPGGGGDSCCVTCGGGEWCGCSVSTPCGSCTGC